MNSMPPTIRGLRAMTVVRWVLLAVITLVAARSLWTTWGPSSVAHSPSEQSHYYCPMHPQIRSPEPGECPICHMNLEPLPIERRSDAPAPARGASPPTAPREVVAVALSADKQQAIGITSSAVTGGSLGRSLRVPGVVNAPETGLAEVRVRAAGFVEKVAVNQTGVRVARGQTLAWIYSPEIYRAQEEFLAATRWNAAPVPGQASTSPVGEIASAARRSLELLGLEETDIQRLVDTGRPVRALPVRAPSAGHVIRFNAVLGSRADPETVLYELADLSTVWVVASVHERDIGSVRSGTRARFAVNGGSAAPIETRVELVEPGLDELTRTGRVRLVLANDRLLVRPGQYGEVTFELPASEGLFVPRDAVIHTGEHQYVYVAGDGDRFEPRSVHTGTETDDRIQILEGLSAGERVVTRGSFMLDSESRLRASLLEQGAR